MISPFSRQAANEIVDAMGGVTAVSLSAKAGSTLNSLVTKSVPLPLRHKGQTQLANRTYDIITDATYTDEAGYCEHDDAMRCAVKDAAETLQANRQLAVGFVTPMIRDTYQQYNEFVAARVDKAAPLVSLIVNNYAAIWSSPLLINAVQKYAVSDISKHKLSHKLPKQPDNVLRDCLSLDSTSAHTELQTWLEEYGFDRAREVFENVFCDGGVTLGVVSGVKHINAQGMTRDDNLAVWLFCRNIMEHMEGELEGRNYDGLKTDIHKAEYAAGRAVYKEIEQRKHANTVDSLFVGIRKREVAGVGSGVERVYEVTVNGDVFKKYINAGGTSEAIMGAAIRQGSTLYSDLLSNKEVLESVYEKSRNALQLGRSKDTRGLKIMAMRQSLIAFNRGLDDDDRHTGLTRKEADERVHLYFKKVEMYSDDDDLVMLRKAVCNIYYPNTNIEFILRTMDDIGERMGVSDPKEAAYLASLVLLTKWVSNFIVVDK